MSGSNFAKRILLTVVFILAIDLCVGAAEEVDASNAGLGEDFSAEVTTLLGQVQAGEGLEQVEKRLGEIIGALNALCTDYNCAYICYRTDRAKDGVLKYIDGKRLVRVSWSMAQAMHARAMALAKMGRHNEAFKLAGEIAKYFAVKNHYFLFNTQADILRILGKFRDAANVYQTAFANTEAYREFPEYDLYWPDLSGIRLSQADCELSLGNFYEAVSILRETQKYFPREEKYLAQLHSLLKQYSPAIREKFFPGKTGEQVYQECLQSFLDGELYPSYQRLESATLAFPEEQSILFFHGALKVFTGELEYGLAHWKDCLRSGAENQFGKCAALLVEIYGEGDHSKEYEGFVALADAQGVPEVFSLVAVAAAIKRGDSDRALHFLQKVKSFLKKPSVDMYYVLVDDLRELGFFRDAAELQFFIMEQTKRCEDAKSYADLLSDCGDHAKALKYYELAVARCRLREEHMPMHIDGLIKCCMNLGNQNKAIEIINKLAKDFPPDSESRKRILMDNYHRLGAYDKAYEIAFDLARESKDEQRWFHAGYLAKKAGKLEEAARCQEGACRVKPSDSNFLGTALAYHKAGNLEKFYEINKEAVYKYKYNKWVNRFNLACGAALTNRGDEAMTELKALDESKQLKKNLLNDKDLESLRVRPDFTELCGKYGVAIAAPANVAPGVEPGKNKDDPDAKKDTDVF
jgi:tetratricopeptide (TPR) repeat protein